MDSIRGIGYDLALVTENVFSLYDHKVWSVSVSQPTFLSLVYTWHNLAQVILFTQRITVVLGGCHPDNMFIQFAVWSGYYVQIEFGLVSRVCICWFCYEGELRVSSVVL